MISPAALPSARSAGSSAAGCRNHADLRSYPSTDAAAPRLPARSPARGSAPPPVVPLHREVRAVELHHHTGPGDRLVLFPHRCADRLDIGGVVTIVTVGLEC